MNPVLSFLTANWQRLGLRELGSPSGLTSVLATPRFQASAHLIFFVLRPQNSRPILVAKVPRIPGDTSRLDIEVKNLQAVHASRPSGFDSIPRIIIYEDYLGNRLLVETALTSPTMRQSVVRSQPEVCIAAVFNWLIDLQKPSAQISSNDNWMARLAERPLQKFEEWIPVNSVEKSLLQRTRECCHLIDAKSLPLVIEHGDLSSPNILMNDQNQIGVVDWELAEPRGLPVVDLFFFLTYIAFSLQKASKKPEYLHAFKRAFFGRQCWTIPHITKYCDALKISSEALRPLFVVCWARYVAGLVQRLKQHENQQGQLSDPQVSWLRGNRFYELWKYSVDHLNDLGF
jgi:aminoglycoside phosphotransferase